MKYWFILSAGYLLSGFGGSGARAQDGPFPEAVITNGPVTAKIYLPHQGKGYYRGSRFDWSGVIHSLEYAGHSYFGKWFAVYDPTLHDAIMGPVDEFRQPLGFDETGAGGEFVKVGVGVLKKPDHKPYTFSGRYAISNPGTWEVDVKEDQVRFVHHLEGVRGFSYRYEKIVRLPEGESRLVLEHRLTNTGKRALETETYNHNFLMIDDEPTGPGLVTTFPFEITAEGVGFGSIAGTENRSVIYRRPLEKGEHVFTAGIQGMRGVREDYDIRIKNIKTGAGVRITGDRPVEKMVYWACPTTACPEPYVKLSLSPGQTTSWEIGYTFFAEP